MIVCAIVVLGFGDCSIVPIVARLVGLDFFFLLACCSPFVGLKKHKEAFGMSLYETVYKGSQNAVKCWPQYHYL